MTRLETVQRKYTELLAEMKKLDREYAKSKKRGDQLQKEQEKSKSELGKTATMKDKLEKLCRELTKENKKVKVSFSNASTPHRIVRNFIYNLNAHISIFLLLFRMKINVSKKPNSEPVASLTSA